MRARPTVSTSFIALAVIFGKFQHRARPVVPAVIPAIKTSAAQRASVAFRGSSALCSAYRVVRSFEPHPKI